MWPAVRTFPRPALEKLKIVHHFPACNMSQIVIIMVDVEVLLIPQRLKVASLSRNSTQVQDLYTNLYWVLTPWGRWTKETEYKGKTAYIDSSQVHTNRLQTGLVDVFANNRGQTQKGWNQTSPVLKIKYINWLVFW